jgi:hypothetical protein
VGKEILGDMAVGGGFGLVDKGGQQDYGELGIKHIGYLLLINRPVLNCLNYFAGFGTKNY